MGRKKGGRRASQPGGSELHASWASWVQRRRKAVRPQNGYLCAAKGCSTPLARLQRGVYQLAERKGKDKQRAKARRPRRGIVSLQASIQLAGWEFGIAHHRGAVRIDPGPPRRTGGRQNWRMRATRLGHSYSKCYMQKPPMQNILRAGSGRVGSARADGSKSPQELHRSLDGKLDTVKFTVE